MLCGTGINNVSVGFLQNNSSAYNSNRLRSAKKYAQAKEKN